MKKYIVIISVSVAVLIAAMALFFYSLTLTNITLTVAEENGQVTATAKHDFSVFDKNVKIYVLLYYSTEFTVDHDEMTLAGYAFDGELKKGETLSVTAPSEGEESFWIARIYYKINDGRWEEMFAGPILCPADNELTEIPS